MIRFPFLLPLLSLACSGENVLEKQQNVAPTILISSHSDGAEFLDGYSESFRAIVSDDDNEFDELQVAWYVGEDIVCDWAVASPAGESFCDIVFAEDDANVIAEVRDTQGAGGRHEIEISVLPTDAPVVELLTPINSVNYYSDQLIQFSALISDTEDEVEDLVITWTSSIDGELSLDTTANSSGEISDYTYLTEGQHAIELHVEDSSGKTDTAEVVIQVGGENNIPTCEITEPADETTVIFGAEVIFRGVADDADIPPTDLAFHWESDKDGDIGSGSINSSGEISLPYSNLSADSHVVTLVVEDEIGAVCQDTIILGVSNPPIVQIDQPTDGAVFTLGENISFQGSVSDQEDLSHELAVIWTSSLDGQLHTGMADTQGLTQFSSDALTAGVHSLTLNVEDSFGLVANDIISVRVNTLPVVDSVSLSPDPLYSSDTLSVSSSSSDVDNDPVTEAYLWFEDGVQTAFTGATISSSELDVGEMWTVRVTPNDGHTDGAYSEASITVMNTDPTISSVTITSSDSPNTYISSVLTCSATASDVDETVTAAYSWDVNGSIYSGASLDLSTVALSPNDSVICTASVADSHGGAASSTASVAVDNQAPSVSSVTITPNTGVSSDTELTCSGVVTDPEEANLTPDYEWFIGGSSAGNLDTLQLNNSLVSPTDTVECVVSVTDAQGATDSDLATVSVDNSNPTVDSISLTPSSATPFDTIICAATASDVDGDALTLSFSFTNLTTSATYTATSSTIADATLDLSTITINPADELECMVIATDTNSGQASDSTSIIVDWTDPTISVSTQGSSYTGDSLTCSGTATDWQGNDLSSSILFQWVNSSDSNAILSSQSTYTIDANDTDVGHNLECIGTVTDQFGYSNSASSAGVPVENTEPTFLTGPEISDYIPEQGDTITCSYTADDIDLDSLQVTYEWYNATDSALITTGAQYLVDDPQGSWSADVGDEINCVVILDDGTDTVSETSPNATVENGAPVISNLAISPNTGVFTGVQLTCSATVIDSTDGNLTSSADYAWTVNGGTTVSTQTTYTVDAAETDVGDSIECTVTAEDSDGEVSTDTTSVTVDNSLPQLNNSQVSPSPAYNDQSLTCSTTLTDADDPTASLTPVYIWQQNGSVIDPSLTGDTIDLSLYAINPQDTISCILNYTDANQGAATDTVTVNIDNRPPPTPTLQINPASPVVAIDDVLCEIAVAPLDDDGDTITYSFSWMQNGSPYQGGTSFTNYADDTIPVSQTNLADVFECTVTSHDGYEFGTDATAAATIAPPFNGTGSWTTSSETLPSASVYHSAIFDADNARILVYGGQGYYQLNTDLLEYDTANQSWAVRGTNGLTAPPLTQASSAFDSATAQWFIFGGETYYALSDELYVLETTLNAETWDAWTPASNAPEARRGGVCVVDEANGLLYVIGGQGYYALLSDIWVLDIGASNSSSGAVWSEIVGTGTAPTKTNAAAGFDPNYEAIYLFGGQEYYKLSDSTACFDTVTETWSYPSFSGDTIPPMHSATVTWSDYLGGFVISGGQSYYQLLDSIYVLIPDGVCSGEVTAVSINSGSVAPHMGATIVQDTINQESILLGGQSYYQLLDSANHFNP